MNILLISPYFNPMIGGVETHLNDLCILFNKQRYTVYVRTYKAFGVKFRGLSEEKKNHIYINRLWLPDFNLIYKTEPYPILKFLYLFPWLFLDCMVFLTRKNKSVDVIQSHGFIAALIAVILGKLFGKRIIVNTHVGFKLKKGVMTSIIKWILLNCKKILVLTNGIRNSLINLGIPESKIEVYHYWVDQKKFKKLKKAKRKLGWENKFVVLFVGRLIEVKGVRTIFDLAKKLNNIIFVIIGSGQLTEEVEQKSSSFKNIFFLGSIDNRDLPKYYSGSDLLLIPSKTIDQDYEEGIPRVMVEALSCGLPVLSTKSGGIQDIFNNKIGRLVGNKNNIKNTILEFYNNRKLRKQIADNCRRYAVKLFSIRNAKIIGESLVGSITQSNGKV